jgi:hypothetical protein
MEMQRKEKNVRQTQYKDWIQISALFLGNPVI